MSDIPQIMNILAKSMLPSFPSSPGTELSGLELVENFSVRAILPVLTKALIADWRCLPSC